MPNGDDKNLSNGCSMPILMAFNPISEACLSSIACNCTSVK